MSLADDIAAFKPKGCATCVWYRSQPEKEQAAFDSWLDNFREHPKSWPLSDLQDLCAQYGLDTNPRSFRECVQAHHSQKAVA